MIFIMHYVFFLKKKRKKAKEKKEKKRQCEIFLTTTMKWHSIGNHLNVFMIVWHLQF